MIGRLSVRWRITLVAAGLFAAIVTFLSYRMDDNSGS